MFFSQCFLRKPLESLGKFMRKSLNKDNSLKNNALKEGKDIKNEFFAEENTEELIHRMATMIYRNSEETKNKIRTILYQSYHHWYSYLKIFFELFL